MTLAAAEAASGEELRQVKLAVEVDEEYRVKQEAFAEAVRRTGLFKSVTLLSDGSTADVVLSWMYHEYPKRKSGFQCFEPYILIATVGLVPEVCEGTHVLSFELSAAKGGNSVGVREAFVQKSVTGWAAIPLNAFSKTWKHNGAFEQFLRYVFLARRDEILRLVSSNTAWQTDGKLPPN